MYTTSLCLHSHVHKSSWFLNITEELACKKDNRREANEYDDHAVGVYKNESLVGHIPIALSSLRDFFRNNTYGTHKKKEKRVSLGDSCIIHSTDTK